MFPAAYGESTQGVDPPGAYKGNSHALCCLTETCEAVHTLERHLL